MYIKPAKKEANLFLLNSNIKRYINKAERNNESKKNKLYDLTGLIPIEVNIIPK